MNLQDKMKSDTTRVLYSKWCGDMSGKGLHLTRGGLISGISTVVTTNDEKSAEVIVGKMYRRTEQYSIQSKDWRL
ncbi:hypothetical protein CYJ03_005925 [Staphylococcus pseudintermedius]|nr:hypothetical protein CYJ03_005925 [Staphylococcus pseudintermedius]